jgi:hypothetical protein
MSLWDYLLENTRVCKTNNKFIYKKNQSSDLQQFFIDSDYIKKCKKGYKNY